MTSQALVLRPTRHGWASYLTGGQLIARFRGPGARARALRYLTRIARLSDP